jgi:hypothetical protein
MSFVVQSVVFYTNEGWDLRKAKAWLKKRGYENKKVDRERDGRKIKSYRFRQQEPRQFKRFVTKKIGTEPRINLILAR